MAGNPVWKVERNINYCRENTTQIHLYDTINMAVMIYQFQDEIQSMQLSADTLSPIAIEIYPKEPDFYSVTKGEIAKEQGKPLLLEEAMSSIEDTKYLSGEDYILEMNKMNTWFTESNGTMGFMLVASILACLLIPLVIVVLIKYFGLKVHFGKMNSTLGKLVTTASTLQSIEKAEARGTVQDQEHREFHVTDLTTNAIFAYEVLFILLVTYGFYKIFISLYKWYNFHKLDFAQTKQTLYKCLLFDKTDIYLQLTNTFGTRTVQIHLGTFFGNPEDIKITGKLAEQYPLELEHGYLLDIISFNWNSFLLNLRELIPFELEGNALVLPLSVTLTGFSRILIRKIFKSTNGMFKIIACKKANCHLTILQPYTKIQNLPTIPNKRRPTKPLRLHLTELMYMDMTNNIPKTPQPTNVIIQQLFNRSCVPIDSEFSNGTKLDRGCSSIPASQVGDHPRSFDLDRRSSQPEIARGSTLQEAGETCVTVEGPPGSGTGGGQPHPDSIQNLGNPI